MTTETTPTQCETPNCQGNTTEEDGSRPAVDDTDVVDKPQIKATINKHGDERNRRLETQQAQFSSHEFTVLERYCDECKSWKETKGLVSTNFCPSCNIPYDKTWLQD